MLKLLVVFKSWIYHEWLGHGSSWLRMASRMSLMMAGYWVMIRYGCLIIDPCVVYFGSGTVFRSAALLVTGYG